jgi:hypothetical protein
MAVVLHAKCHTFCALFVTAAPSVRVAALLWHFGIGAGENRRRSATGSPVLVVCDKGHYHTLMYRSLSSLIPKAGDLLNLEIDALGNILLTHLKSYEGQSGNSVYQNGLLSQSNFIRAQEQTGYGQKPEYGDKQAQVSRALMEAWNWLEHEGILIRDPTQPAPWFSISRRGEELIKQNARFEQWEKLGLDRVRSDLTQTGGIREIGGSQEVRDLAWKWVQMKEAKATAIARQQAAASRLTVIADSRLAELQRA